MTRKSDLICGYKPLAQPRMQLRNKLAHIVLFLLVSLSFIATQFAFILNEGEIFHSPLSVKFFKNFSYDKEKSTSSNPSELEDNEELESDDANFINYLLLKLHGFISPDIYLAEIFLKFENLVTKSSPSHLLIILNYHLSLPPPSATSLF